MHADASERDRPPHDTGLSWTYRSEAFAEDLDEAPRVASVVAPTRRESAARPIRAALRVLTGYRSPRLAG